MPQLLASDVANPEFVGAQNPDSLLHCEFYMHNPVDKWASEEASYKEGRTITIRKYKAEVPFARIMRPGDSTSIIETEVREEHKRRWPNQWLYFQMNNGMLDEGAQMQGWKLQDWDELKDQPEQVRDLNYKRFYTVEQLAGASDGSVQGLGIGGLGLREKARKSLRDKIAADVTSRIDEKDKAIATLQEQVAQLLAAQQAKPDVKPRKQAPDG